MHGLSEVETLQGFVNDPCRGFGTIVEAAKRAGFEAHGCYLVDRGYAGTYVEDFLRSRCRRGDIVCNPPFSLAERLVQHALTLTADNIKIAIIFPVPRLNTAGRWLTGVPLQRIWLLSPRPSMPPGHVIAAGKNASGGKEDFCWPGGSGSVKMTQLTY